MEKRNCEKNVDSFYERISRAAYLRASAATNDYYAPPGHNQICNLFLYFIHNLYFFFKKIAFGT